MHVGGCGFMCEKIRLGTSYRFLYLCRQDFGSTNQITERNYDIINQVRAHNLQHEMFTTERLCARDERHLQKRKLQDHHRS